MEQIQNAIEAVKGLYPELGFGAPSPALPPLPVSTIEVGQAIVSMMDQATIEHASEFDAEAIDTSRFPYIQHIDCQDMNNPVFHLDSGQRFRLSITAI